MSKVVKVLKDTLNDIDGILDEEDSETILNTEINIIKVEVVKLN
ncbi:hypothetical protein [Clostridium sp.]|nr:hypothetical protein [Clostridium sp.]MDU2284110.1 hypothetical protein [Clostridium sp.]MDY5099749.1 hypothetical protein [Clostridium sp.]